MFYVTTTYTFHIHLHKKNLQCDKILIFYFFIFYNQPNTVSSPSMGENVYDVGPTADFILLVLVYERSLKLIKYHVFICLNIICFL